MNPIFRLTLRRTRLTGYLQGVPNGSHRHCGGFLLIAAILTLVALAGCGLDEQARPATGSVAIEGLYPDFDPARPAYVSHCGRGAAAIQAEASGGVKVRVGSGPPETGAISLDPGVGPGEDFEMEITEAGQRRAYEVRCLPADFPAWRFEALSTEATPGFFFVVSFKAARDERPWVIVFDSEGVPRWWYSPTTRVLWAQVLSDGTVAWARSFGDGYGLDPRMAHEVHSLSSELVRLVRTKGSIIDGHEFRELGNGNVLVDSYVPETADLTRFGGPARAAIVSAEIQELDPHGRVLWRWNSRGHISLAETGRWWRNVLSNPRHRLQGRQAFDPLHINAIEPRGSEEVVISTRHTDAIYG